MIHRKNRLDTRILVLAVALPLVGILATSPPIPEFNFCASPDFPESERVVLSRALQDLKEETAKGKKILGSPYRDYSGFSRAEDRDYGGTKKMMQDLEMIRT